MYSAHPSFVLGFHGCDKSVADKIFAGTLRLEVRPKSYDWLGHGIYFWENSPERAMQWATEKKKRSKRSDKDAVKTPTVIGAVVDLGYCLDLLDVRALALVKDAYVTFKKIYEKATIALPENKSIHGEEDRLLRNLDCAVIEHLNKARESQGLDYYDTVRGIFVEGDKLYENAGFNEKNHIQLCIRNPNCIKGYFRPLGKVASYDIP